MTVELSPVNIVPLVSDILEGFDPQVKQKNIQLLFDKGELDETKIATDERKIRHIVLVALEIHLLKGLLYIWSIIYG